MLVTLRLAGQLIETRVRANATAALQAIEALAPESARRVDEDQAVPIAALATGDRILVDAGAVVPIDGVIDRAARLVARARLPGESGRLLRGESCGRREWQSVESTCVGG